VQRFTLRNIVLLIAANLLVKPFYLLGVDAEVQNQVGAEAYGRYFALLNLCFLFNILLDLGTASHLTRFMAQEPKRAGKQLLSFLLLRLGLVLPYMGGVLGIYLLLGYPAQGDALTVVLLLAMGQVFSGLVMFVRAGLAGMHRFGADRLLSVLDRLLLIAVVGWMLWGARTDWFSIMDFATTQAMCYGAAALVALAMLPWRTWTSGVDMGHVRGAFRQSLPFALLALFMMAYTRMDAVMLDRLLDDNGRQAGYYAQGFRVLDALNSVALLMSTILLPVFSRMLVRKQEVAGLAGMAMRLVLLGAVPVAVMGCLWPEEILNLRYTSWADASAPAFRLLMVTFVGAATTYVYGTLLTAAGDLRFLNRLALLGLLLNGALNVLLIPDYGAEGAGFATMVTQCLIAAGHVWRSRQRFSLRVDVKLLGGAILFSVSLVLSGLGLGQTELSWPVQIGILAVAVPLLALVVKLVPGVGWVLRLVRKSG
jgi:O-antigen/teichoic acid export membrane protein